MIFFCNYVIVVECRYNWLCDVFVIIIVKLWRCIKVEVVNCVWFFVVLIIEKSYIYGSNLFVKSMKVFFIKIVFVLFCLVYIKYLKRRMRDWNGSGYYIGMICWRMYLCVLFILLMDD